MKQTQLTTTVLTILALLAHESLAAVQTFRCGKVDATKDTEYEKGEKFYLCIHFEPFGVMVPFKLSTDHFSVIELKDSKENPKIAKFPKLEKLLTKNSLQSDERVRHQSGQKEAILRQRHLPLDQLVRSVAIRSQVLSASGKAEINISLPYGQR